MKITKSRLKQIILEELKLSEQEPPTTRQKQITKATSVGSKMTEEEYSEVLLDILSTEQVVPAERLKALMKVFGASVGARINTAIEDKLNKEKNNE